MEAVDPPERLSFLSFLRRQKLSGKETTRVQEVMLRSSREVKSPNPPESEQTSLARSQREVGGREISGRDTFREGPKLRATCEVEL